MPSSPSLGRRVYRFLFRFFGPAEVSHDPDPTRGSGVARGDDFRCPVCRFPLADHEWSTTAGRRRMVCPGPPADRPA